jgi:peptide/nickel transport system permease protein
MLSKVVKRLLMGGGLVLAVVTATFLLINLAPGDPARLWVGPSAGAAELEAARHALGLDRPLILRYLTWLWHFATGDWGLSLIQNRPVSRIVLDALPHTIILSTTSIIVTYVGGVLVGLFQAARRNSVRDRALTLMTLVLYGMPAYWLAAMLVLIFTYLAARQGWPAWLQFPAMGVSSLDADFLTPWERWNDSLRHLALPLVTLGAIGIAGTARFVRGAVLDVRNRPFVFAARARGLTTRRVEVRYILRNALIPVITLLGLSLPALFSGTVFVEVIFAWPGMGRAIVSAVASRDYPVVMATTVIFAGLVVIGNLLADLCYALLDPRLREAR